MAHEASNRRAEAAWRRLFDHLDGIRRETGAELLAYPQPSTECDLHYRDLLERRRDVNAELSALRDNPPPAAPDAAWRSWLRGRIKVSAFTPDELKDEIIRLLSQTEKAV